MRKYHKNLLFFVLLCIGYLTSNAQLADTLEVHRGDGGNIRFARFKNVTNHKMQNGEPFLHAVLGAGPDHEFRLNREGIDKYGYTHKRFQQYYKGIKVENAVYLIHGKEQFIETINGEYKEIDISSVNPVLNESQALTKALTFVHAKKYKWEDPAYEKFAKESANDPLATYYPKGELVISDDRLKGGKNMQLAWKFQISSQSPDNEQVIYIDAKTGEAINQVSLIYDSNISLTADTRYSGTKTITGDSYSSGYRLNENRNGVNLQTLNQQYSDNLPGVDISNSSSTSFTSSYWSNFSADQSALDAHWATEKVFDFWLSVFGRNSVDGNGLRMLSFVHSKSNWDNARWIGGSGYPNPNYNNYVQLGDGSGSIFHPLVSLDVVAHEYGHGISQFTSNLVYGFDETGAISEGISDIWGACIEYWVDPTKDAWKIGEEIMANGAPCLRSLINPKTGGDPSQSSTGGCPNTYHGQYWDKSNEPHINSTIISHWFYLLVNGGSGVNDLSNAYSLTAIGISKAQAIVYKAQTDYLGTKPIYSDARTAMILAAQNIYGVGSCEEVAVTNAWYAVGVGAQYISSSIPVLSGSNAICSSETYTLSNVPSGATIIWSVSNTTDLTVAPASSGLSATVSRNNSNPGVSSVSVSFTGGCNIFISKTVGIGIPYYSGNYTNEYTGGSAPLGVYPDVTNDACTGYHITTDINIIGGASPTWSKITSNGVVPWSQTGDNLDFYLWYTGEYAQFRVSATNGCGTATQDFLWQANNCTGTDNGCAAFTVSPNPSNGSMTISVPSILPPCNGFSGTSSTKTNKQADLVIHEARIYDNTKALLKIISGSKGKQLKVIVPNLSPGIYFVQIIGTNGYTETKQVIITPHLP